MAETTTGARAQPLSPHLGIYRFTITMAMSIVHRLTGMALYAGTLLLAWWLLALADGPDALAVVGIVLGNPFGKLVLIGFTWALLHHMLGGLRHFVWDSGRGFELRSANALSWLTLLGSLALTALIWVPQLNALGWF